FNRVKHGKPAQIDNPHVLPEQAIRFCLEYAGLQASDIDLVGYSFDPRLRRTEYHAEWWPDPRMETTFLQCLDEVRDAVDRLFGRKLGKAFKFVPHHLAHAASAYYPSGFETA